MDHGNNYLHLTAANTTVNAKSGPGTLHTFSVNEVGTAFVTVYDGLNGTGAVIANIDPSTKDTHIYDAAFTVGLSVVVGAGAGTLDATVTYR